MEENKISAWTTAEQNRKISDLKQRGETEHLTADVEK